MKLFLNKGKSVAEHAVFVVALPSYGNAGQLAVDAMIATLNSHVVRIGCIESKDVLPLTGCT